MLKKCDLPICRLCKSDPYVFYNLDVECSNPDCIRGEFSQEQWRKLMYVPAKKPKPDFSVSIRDRTYNEGYNAAIDEILNYE